jgi:glycosyltransferase involved in cell wall biosynthesis
VKLHLNYKNLGLLESRNKGVEMANGDVVAFIDDDAVAEKNWIEELVKMYKMGAIAAGGKIVPFWVAKKPIWLPEEFYWMIGATYLGFPEKVTEVRNTFGSNLSFKRDIFLRLGGFNVKMGGIKGSKMLQGGETELCERMRKRYGKGLTYNPDAIVYHKVFEKRTKLSFLIKRAFWQGYSKAVMEGIAGDIGEEKGFLRYLLINRTLSRLNEAIRGSGEDLSKLIFIWIFTTCVGAGYIYAKF